jgi:hypothetical protein
MLAAKDIVFCFGKFLPDAEVLSVHPRSIGIAGFAEKFVISFLEATMPLANDAPKSWARALRRQPAGLLPLQRHLALPSADFRQESRRLGHRMQVQ